MKVYARHVPTNDETLKNLAPEEASKKRDVIISREPNGQPIARYPWHYKDRPTKATKTAVLFGGVQVEIIWTEADS